MKQFLWVATLAILSSFIVPPDSLTSKERKDAIAYLRQTRTEIVRSVKGLSEAQLNFKAGEDKWSIKDCLNHIALSEAELWKWAESVLQSPATPEKKQEVKITDEQVKEAISDRSHKAKAGETLNPVNAKWADSKESLKAFLTERDKLIQFVKSTSDDLRSHISPETAFGPLDSYQLILLIASHSNRHRLQIDEIRAHPDFPAR